MPLQVKTGSPPIPTYLRLSEWSQKADQLAIIYLLEGFMCRNLLKVRVIQKLHNSLLPDASSPYNISSQSRRLIIQNLITHWTVPPFHHQVCIPNIRNYNFLMPNPTGQHQALLYKLPPDP
jgi:hypothetical protein